MAKRQRGRIILSYSIVCGKCGREVMTGGRSAPAAREEARRGGWTQDLICRDCRPRVATREERDTLPCQDDVEVTA